MDKSNLVPWRASFSKMTSVALCSDGRGFTAPKILVPRPYGRGAVLGPDNAIPKNEEPIVLVFCAIQNSLFAAEFEAWRWRSENLLANEVSRDVHGHANVPARHASNVTYSFHTRVPVPRISYVHARFARNTDQRRIDRSLLEVLSDRDGRRGESIVLFSYTLNHCDYRARVSRVRWILRCAADPESHVRQLVYY